MNSQFNVVFTGELKPGTDRDAFIKAFSQRFQCSEEKAAQLLESNKAITMKSAVEKDVAEKFRDVLDDLGMMIRLEPLPSSPQPTPSEAPSSPANPYQAPEARLDQPQNDGEMTGPVSVPFGHGISWIGTAFSNHFKVNPFAWIGSFVVLIIVAFIVQLIPFLGALATTLFSPVIIAGYMLGAQAQDEGEDFTVGHVFSGFKQSMGQLVLVGLLYFVGFIVIGIVAAVLMGGSMAMSGAFGHDPAAVQEMAKDPTAFLLPFLIIMALGIPLAMTYWFAPALVALDGMSAIEAMKLSFSGCLKNILPLLLYGIVMFVLMMIAVLPFGLGMLILIPLMTASMYTSYRDIFYPEA